METATLLLTNMVKKLVLFLQGFLVGDVLGQAEGFSSYYKPYGWWSVVVVGVLNRSFKGGTQGAGFSSKLSVDRKGKRWRVKGSDIDRESVE